MFHASCECLSALTTLSTSFTHFHYFFSQMASILFADGQIHFGISSKGS